MQLWLPGTLVVLFLTYRYVWPTAKDWWSYDPEKMRRETAERNRRDYADKTPRQFF